MYSELTGDYSFHRVASSTGTESICSYQPRVVKTGPNDRLVAWVHTHPIRDFELYDCPEKGLYNWTANSEEQGGGSNDDWDWATAERVPFYTIDPDRMWRLEPNTPAIARPGNPQRWSAAPSGTCSPRAPF